MVHKSIIVENFPGRTFGDIIYNLKLSFKFFRKFFYAIWNFRAYDSTYTLEILKICLQEHLSEIASDSGMQEIDKTRLPKEEKLKRAIELLDNTLRDDYAERCGYDYNYDFNFEPFEEEGKEKLFEMKTTTTEEQEVNNTRALKEANELEIKEWEEFTTILQYELKGWWT
jgi:hypothetical protein